MGALFTQLFNFLIYLLNSTIAGLINLFIDLINAIISLIASTFQGLLVIFPNINMTLTIPPEITSVANNIAWFFPLSTFAVCLGILSTCYIAYFTLKPILKFLHVA